MTTALLLLLAALAAGASIGALTTLLRIARRLDQVEQRWHGALDTPARQVELLTRAAKATQERLGRIEEGLRELAERQVDRDTHASDSRGFRHAIALVERGWDVDELVRSCGLSRAEAELVHRLHAAQGAAAAGNGTALRARTGA